MTEKINFGKNQEFYLKNKLYIKEGETLEQRIDEIVGVVRKHQHKYQDLGLADRVKKLIVDKVLIPSTPQLANAGRYEKEGTSPLPCSCNVITVGNSIQDIYYSIGETAMLSKLGAGVGANIEQIFPKGTEIEKGFFSNSKLDWAEDIVRTAQKVSQSSVRRGYAVVFDSITSPEFYDLLKRVDRTNPDKSDPFATNNLGIHIPKGFMEEMEAGNKDYQKRFLTLVQKRKQTGNIYVVFDSNMDKNKSEVYERQNVTPSLTNICTESSTPAYKDKTFACVLASLNLTKWDYIKKNPQAIKDSYIFLDIMVEEYIELTEGVPFLEKARRSAIEKRDVALGTLGFHDYIQEKGCAFGDVQSRVINKSIYKTIQKYCKETNIELANTLGACPMAKEVGLNFRNVSMNMIAPNKTTSFIAGDDVLYPSGVSLGIEPIMSNYFVKDLAGISVTFKNRRLEKVLEELGKNTPEVWQSISDNIGSVSHLDFLSDYHKRLFKTFAEISPKDIIDLASDRQEFIDMAQSINLVSRNNYSIQDLYDIHKYAYDKGIKTLYYMYPQAHAVFATDGDRWDACESCAD